jgi:GTP-binding protein EngB required for normal cell division
VLTEPLFVTLLRLGEHQPQQCLRDAVAEIRWMNPELRSETNDEWTIAQQLVRTGVAFLDVSVDLEVDELVAIGLCSAHNPDFMTPMNKALCSGEMAGAGANQQNCWKTLFANFMSGVAKLPSARSSWNSFSEFENSKKLFHAARIPRHIWEAHLQAGTGDTVCFYEVLRAAAHEQSLMLSLASNEAEDDVQCIFEFSKASAYDASGLFGHEGEDDVKFLPPYTQGIVKGIHAEKMPDSNEDVFRVCIDVVRSVEPLASIIQAPAESTLAGALLVGLHTSTVECSSPLLNSVAGCFEALAAAVTVKSPEAVTAVWKGYFECLLEGISIHSRKDISETIQTGPVHVAKVAVTDFVRAAHGVTKRALGCESAMNRVLMAEERARRMEDTEQLKWKAVAVARDEVKALELETLTDADGFIKFVQHDPVKAFEVAPAAGQAYLAAEPAQRVLIFAKLIGLAVMAGRLLRGDPQVQRAFDSSFPLSGGCWDTVLDLPPDAADEVPPPCTDGDRLAEARRALTALRLQQLHLARTRLMIVGGAPDVGKTTLLRKTFDLAHLTAGLNHAARTEQLTFELHPHGNEQHRPIYLVDTPGFGDGEELHRNDMARLLLGAGSWLPHGTTLLWVIKAGRNVRQEADELLRKFAASSFTPIVVVTHIDKLFEDRYREVGPEWKKGELEGVPAKDPRWAEKRRKLMNELRDEVADGIQSILGKPELPEIVYACLGGWMASSEPDDEDEFAQAAPWSWARQELTEVFAVQGHEDLRRWLDGKLGLL